MRKTILMLMLLTSSAFSAEPVYSWRTISSDPDRIYLYRDGQQIGGWCYRAQHFRALDGETWSEPTAMPPVAPPKRMAATSITVQSSGNGRLLGLRLDQSLNSVADGVAKEALTGSFMENAIKNALASPTPNSAPSTDEQLQTILQCGQSIGKLLFLLMNF